MGRLELTTVSAAFYLLSVIILESSRMLEGSTRHLIGVDSLSLGVNSSIDKVEWHSISRLWPFKG